MHTHYQSLINLLRNTEQVLCGSAQSEQAIHSELDHEPASMRAVSKFKRNAARLERLLNELESRWSPNWQRAHG